VAVNRAPGVGLVRSEGVNADAYASLPPTSIIGKWLVDTPGATTRR
jgi:hypothetical protein